MLGGVAIVFLSLPILAKSIRALCSGKLVVTPRPDHPALRVGVPRLAVKQGLFFLLLGLFFAGAGVFVLVMLIRAYGVGWFLGQSPAR